MSTIKINDLNETKADLEQEAADVKGGPAFMKLGDIKGEFASRDADPLPTEEISFGYNRI